MTERQTRGSGKPERQPKAPALPTAPEAQPSQNGHGPTVYSIGPAQAPDVMDAAWKEYLQVIKDKKFEDPRRQPSHSWLHKRFDV